MKTIISLIILSIVIVSSLIFTLSSPPVQQLSDLTNQTEINLLKNFGKESRSQTFTLNENTTLGEKYITIYNTYPPNNPETYGTEIKELECVLPSVSCQSNSP